MIKLTVHSIFIVSKKMLSKPSNRCGHMLSRFTAWKWRCTHFAVSAIVEVDTFVLPCCSNCCQNQESRIINISVGTYSELLNQSLCHLHYFAYSPLDRVLPIVTKRITITIISIKAAVRRQRKRWQYRVKTTNTYWLIYKLRNWSANGINLSISHIVISPYEFI